MEFTPTARAASIKSLVRMEAHGCGKSELPPPAHDRERQHESYLAGTDSDSIHDNHCQDQAGNGGEKSIAAEINLSAVLPGHQPAADPRTIPSRILNNVAMNAIIRVVRAP